MIRFVFASVFAWATLLALSIVGLADDRWIHGLLAGRCLECHSGSDTAGGLDLSHRAGIEGGSDSGPVIAGNTSGKVHSDWSDSLLWQVIESGRMPPKAKLNDEEKESLRVWIANGASLPDTPIDRLGVSSPYRAGYDWWALQPISVATPIVPSDDSWARNPIDAYLIDAMQQRGLQRNPPASPRSLLRRVTVDLTGLPPSYDDLKRFESDPSDVAYEAVVDRLLASPHYGERWARHWLDIVRFGESDGFERNYPRFNGWPYRDWVVHAFNDDLPYDEFVRMQIAGDILDPTPSGLAAASFLVCGIHNTVVGDSDRMKRIAKQDELEEKIGTLSQTFLGMTAQCARCHEHKYDPISSESYYQLASALQGVQHGDREVMEPEVQQAEKELEQTRVRLAEHARELDRRALAILPEAAGPKDLEGIPVPLVAWDFEKQSEEIVHGLRGELHGNGNVDARGLILDGQSYLATVAIPTAVASKTLVARVSLASLDQSGGGVISLQTLDGSVFDAIVFGEREPGQWMAGSNGFVRSQSFHGPSESVAPDQPVHIAIRYSADGVIQAFRNGVPYGAPYKISVQHFDAGTTQVLIGLRHTPSGGNKFFRGVVHSVACFDSALSDDAIAMLAAEKDFVENLKLAWESMSVEDRRTRQQVRDELERVDSELTKVRAQSRKKIYTVISSATPGPTHILVRGDVYQEGALVQPGGIASLEHDRRPFGLDETSSDAQRRMALADWVVTANRPLLARVLVNRLWHYHFGTGIVDTPNDFGFNGGRPSHPELLDYLASTFMESGMSIKDMNRRIVLSSAYRSSTQPASEPMARDTNNRLLWRYPLRRLDGETARDSMLAIAGAMRSEFGGPSYQDVDFREFNGSTYYVPKEAEGSDCFRRTVYRFNPRCERSPLLDVLDCPDPSATAPRRANTNTPLQALSLLNNAFIFQMSDALVARLQSAPHFASDQSEDSLIRSMFREILLRDPTLDEATAAERLIRSHGPVALARALWNANEFLVLD